MKYVFLRPRQFVYILTIILAIDVNPSDDQFVYRYIDFQIPININFLKRIQLIGETLRISQSGAYIDMCKNLF